MTESRRTFRISIPMELLIIILVRIDFGKDFEIVRHIQVAPLILPFCDKNILGNGVACASIYVCVLFIVC